MFTNHSRVVTMAEVEAALFGTDADQLDNLSTTDFIATLEACDDLTDRELVLLDRLMSLYAA